MNVLVVGAGIFGCSIAEELSKRGINTTLIDKNNDIMSNASKHNHNRLHLGFHYPRSKETALQSIDGLLSFMMYFKDAVVKDFPNYYAITNSGHVSGEYFQNFCDDIGLFYTKEYPNRLLMSTDIIDDCFKVNEPIFDYNKLKSLVIEGLMKQKNLTINLNTEFNPSIIGEYDYIVNSSYSNLNDISSYFTKQKLEIKLQDVVIPIVEFNSEPFGITVMDGPFCSVMPDGFNKNKFLVYHVVESVIEEKISEPIVSKTNVDLQGIVNKSSEIYPFLKGIKIVDYRRTIRALPINNNDERLSEVFLYDDTPKLISVLSGKISTCKKVGLEVYNYITTNKLKTNILL